MGTRQPFMTHILNFQHFILWYFQNTSFCINFNTQTSYLFTRFFNFLVINGSPNLLTQIRKSLKRISCVLWQLDPNVIIEIVYNPDVEQTQMMSNDVGAHLACCGPCKKTKRKSYVDITFTLPL